MTRQQQAILNILGFPHQRNRRPKNLPEAMVHCGECGCQLHYLDSWASDSGYLCDECATAEMDTIARELSDRRLEVDLET